MKSRLLAIVDIGSNTIRSMIVEVLDDGTYRTLDEERAVPRLAAGLSRRHRLSAAAMQAAVDALGRMADIIRSRGVRKVTVVATSAIREACNRRAFLDRIRAKTGLKVRVISGPEEARLAFESATASFELVGRSCAVADIGGGSSEVILAAGSAIREVHSLRLGAVALTEEFLDSDPVKGEEFKAMRRRVRAVLSEAGIDTNPPVQFLIASGGTATTIAQMAMAREGLQGRSVQGYEMTQAEILHLRQALLRRSLSERRQMPGLSADRADIILAGATILYELMDQLQVNSLRVSARGIRHALLNRMIGRTLSKSPPTPRPRMAVAESFGRSLGFELKHGEQAQRLALMMFDQVAQPLGIDPYSRDLLSAAALLHDVGYVVAYRQHHKHSYHLISHAHLDGFTPREREIIAQIARFHRRAAPRKKHKEWAALPKDDRELVRRLTSLLRIADALDRRHSQGIQDLRCRLDRRRLLITVAARRDVSVEIHGAQEKADLFEETFGRKVVFRTAAAQEASRSRAASGGGKLAAAPPGA